MMSPSHLVTACFSHTHISCATWLISLKSWLTSTSPPSHSFSASARESIVSMSRWFVGSSSSSMCGSLHANHANITLLLCPSDRFLIGITCAFPDNPNLPMAALILSSSFPGYSFIMYCRADMSRSSFSARCWWNCAILRWLCRLTMPSSGMRSPVMSLRSVLFPAPLGPTSATLESRSTPKSRFL
ncbi:Os09g0572450 [Oryza sativa Japonica Group]|uniref:Os09g0572450 protein n=1 Tax=Oryza sativa subsp. japonica TaxID=39947 RepID=A0A0P0XRX2_ORYSJ|nr:hypothetical protein EE612_049620 [Oryza sativa]BAT09539.1 Os09g0572450 [Oryza sativa Japonica Group]